MMLDEIKIIVIDKFYLVNYLEGTVIMGVYNITWNYFRKMMMHFSPFYPDDIY
jgi:hypothetical protein